MGRVKTRCNGVYGRFRKNIRHTLLMLYLALFGVIIVALRLTGRGWIGAVTGGLVLAGLLCTLLVLVGDCRRRR